MRKLKTIEKVRDDIQNNPKEKFGLVGGYFDLLHIGHVSFLEECCKNCDNLVVYVHNDKTAKSIKGKARPFVSAYERALLLTKLEIIHSVFIVPYDYTKETISEFDERIICSVGPAVYFCVEEGNDYSERINRLHQRFECINIVSIPRQSKIWSTTFLADKILNIVEECTNIDDIEDSISKIKRTSEQNHWIRKLRTAEHSSSCGLSSVYALITKGDKLVSTGRNDKINNAICWCQENKNSANKFHHPRCLALHAEHRAILEAIEKGYTNNLSGATVYIDKSPCFDCAKLLLHYGINQVVYIDEYTESDGKNLLLKNGVDVIRYIGRDDFHEED